MYSRCSYNSGLNYWRQRGCTWRRGPRKHRRNNRGRTRALQAGEGVPRPARSDRARFPNPLLRPRTPRRAYAQPNHSALATSPEDTASRCLYFTLSETESRAAPPFAQGPGVGRCGSGSQRRGGGDVAREHHREGTGRGTWAPTSPEVESRRCPGTQASRAGGHYLLPGASLRRRRGLRGPGPHGVESGSRAAGRAPRDPLPNRGSR